MFSFGPIPSRRLGRSLGINNIPPKICPYTCIYCQQGHSSKMQLERQAFYDPKEIYEDVKAAVERTTLAGEVIDYLSFVPDGEPTLDINLGTEIDLLRPLGVKIAVITNASLLWRQDVQDELLKADWVSVKVDAVDEAIWRKVDHPLKALSLTQIQEGILAFSRAFTGELYTETMLVKGINDDPDHLREVAHFIARVAPHKAYLSIPTRPPADHWVEAPDEETITHAFEIFRTRIDQVECLLGYEGNSFSSTGNVAEDLLSISSVHPMREDAVLDLLDNAGESWAVVDDLLQQEQLVQIQFDGKNFYMRKLFDGYKR